MSFAQSSLTQNYEQHYRLGKEAITTKNWPRYQDAVSALTPSPLQPYLQFIFFRQEWPNLELKETLDFLMEHQTKDFFFELALPFFRRQLDSNNYQIFQDYKSLLQNHLTLQCIAIRADLSSNLALNPPTTLKATLEPIKEKWLTQISLPQDCHPLEEILIETELTQEELIQKIEERFRQNYLTQGEKLLSSLPTNKRNYYQHFLSLLRNPTSLTRQTNFYPNSSPLYREVLTRWSAQNSVASEEGLQLLHSQNLLTESDYRWLRNRITTFKAGRVDVPNRLSLFQTIPSHEGSDTLWQWGVRLALQEGELSLAKTYLNYLSQAAKEEDIWRFWQGYLLELDGDLTGAKAIYETLADRFSFYGFLAADKLGQPYHSLKELTRQTMAEEGEGDLLTEDFYLALSLSRVGEDTFARRLWVAALNRSNPATKHKASLLAHQEKNINLSLIAALQARAQGALSLRYPMPYLSTIEANLDEGSPFTPELILGLIRQESHFHIQAKSAANAYGLMQLLIPTAESVSQALGEGKRDSLYLPEANLRYGIHYLKQLETKVGSCLPHILASYNAGPHKVREWQKMGITDILLWIESIPYHETRNYVKSVLGNTVIYHALNKNPKTLSSYLECF